MLPLVNNLTTANSYFCPQTINNPITNSCNWCREGERWQN